MIAETARGDRDEASDPGPAGAGIDPREPDGERHRRDRGQIVLAEERRLPAAGSRRSRQRPRQTATIV